MLRRLVGLVCLLSIVCCGIVGCATAFNNRSQSFRRGEQKEPQIEDTNDGESKDYSNWQKETTQMRGESKRKPARDGWLDNLIWSDESREIGRSLNADL